MRSAEDIITRQKALAGRRTTWETHVQECADFVHPRDNQIVDKQFQGQKRRENLYDSTAIRANERLASGLFSYLSPPNKRWFNLKPKRKEDAEQPEVKAWFNEVTRILYENIATSNFGLECHELFLGLGYAGTGLMYLDEGTDRPLNFQNVHFAHSYIDEGYDGIIDTCFRVMWLTARQAIQFFGDEVSNPIKGAAADLNKTDDKFEFIHAVFPREERDETKIDNKNFKYASIYVDVTGKKVVREGGYPEMCFMAPRFVKDSNEIYGRGPAMSVLPDIKMLNQMRLTTLKAAHKLVDPPLIVPDDGTMPRLNTGPSALIYWLPNQWGAKPEALQTNANIPISLEMIQDERENVRGAFYEDLFAMLLNHEGGQMTATEVLERVEEKLTIFAPTWGRLQTEFYEPMIIRSMGVLQRLGMFPQPPSAVIEGDMDYEIEYTSKLAILIKMMEFKAVQDTFASVAPYAEIKPEILDRFKLDDIPKFAADTFGVPSELMRTDDELQEFREQRAQAMEAQENKEMAMELAKSQNLSQNVEPNSPIEMMGGALAGG